MKKTLFAGAFVAVLSIGLFSCYNDQYDKLYPAPVTPVVCDTTTVSFAHDITPIFQANCETPGCHEAGATTSGLDLTTYTGASSTLSRRNILGDITFSSGSTGMPKGGSKIPDCDINKNTKWANEGFPNN